MRWKKQISKKHHPTRYLKFKGCFGGKGYWNPNLGDKPIRFPSVLKLNDDRIAKRFLKLIQNSLDNGEKAVDFSKLQEVEISCGIILRAYADEFQMLYGYPIKVIKPKNKKAEAILRYLCVMPPNESYKKYPDLECWNILAFDNLDEKSKNTIIGKQLIDEFIPKCWKNHIFADDESQAVASAVSEIYFNCAEHAYAGFDNESFQKWYIGAGEYPDSKKFEFCIFDRGQGFKKSMQKNVTLWGIFKSKKDSFYLKRAAQGISGLDEAAKQGRGKGISTSIKRIKEVKGDIVIISGNGEYSSAGTSQIQDRKLYLRGSLVSFFVLIERRSMDYLMGKKNNGRENLQIDNSN